MITIEVDEAVAKLKASFQDVTPYKMAEITAKSLNSAMRVMRYHGAKEISRVYNISDLSYVTSKWNAKRATPGMLETYLYADRRGIQLAKFAPANTMAMKGKGSQLTVEVRRGERKVVKSAFWANANKGKGNELSGVFARGKYAGREFAFRTKRIVKSGPDLPIGLLRTTSPFSMLGDKSVRALIEDKGSTQFTKAFDKEMSRLIRGTDSSSSS